MNCDIIRDLLPLYADDVCSAASRELVEQHLETCEDCRRELAVMRCGEPAVIAEELGVAQAAGKAWKKNKLRSAVIGLLLAAMAFGLVYGLTVPNIVPVEERYLSVGDVYRMADGTIRLDLFVTDGKKHNFVRYRTVDGAFYITPMQPIIGSLEDPRWTERKNTTIHNIGGAAIGSALYVGWGKDAILVWEEGMELPEAPTFIEEEWKELRGE